MDEKDLERYFKKSGDTTIQPDNLIVTDDGFATWTIDQEDNTLVGLNVYGNGKYWEEFGNELAKKLGCKKIRVATKRSPKAFVKKYGFELVGYILEKEVD